MRMLLDEGREIMIKLVNGIPEKLVEMDERIMFVQQMDEDDTGPVILINKFNVGTDVVTALNSDRA